MQSAVPTTLDAVLDTDWLTEALDDIGDGDRIVGVDEVDSSKTLAQKVRFRVTVERADGARVTRAYCVKAHLDGSLGTDILSEARYYGELAPQLDVRSPRAYYTAVDDEAQQAIIIMDDVVANGGRFMSAQTPYSLDTTRDTLGQLARLHAATWGCEQVADLANIHWWNEPPKGGHFAAFEQPALFVDEARSSFSSVAMSSSRARHATEEPATP